MANCPETPRPTATPTLWISASRPRREICGAAAMREILRILRFAWFVIGLVQGIRKGAQEPEPAGEVDRLRGAPALCSRLDHATELPNGRVGLVAADPDFHRCSLATGVG